MKGGEVDYRDMALNCIRDADATDDPVLKKTLLGVANLYNQTARLSKSRRRRRFGRTAPANQ